MWLIFCTDFAFVFSKKSYYMNEHTQQLIFKLMANTIFANMNFSYNCFSKCQKCLQCLACKSIFCRWYVLHGAVTPKHIDIWNWNFAYIWLCRLRIFNKQEFGKCMTALGFCRSSHIILLSSLKCSLLYFYHTVNKQPCAVCCATWNNHFLILFEQAYPMVYND